MSSLITARARDGAKTQPFVGRGAELNAAKEKLIDPTMPAVRAVFVSGNAGIGRRTFARRLYSDVFPSVASVFPQISIDTLDGYHEIYRKINIVVSPIEQLSAFKTRIFAFSIANDMEKIAQIVSLLDRLFEARETIVMRDRGGLLDDDGGFQEPIRSILSRVRSRLHPPIILIAERMVPQRRRSDIDGIVYCPLPSLQNHEVRQLIGLLLRNTDIKYSSSELDHMVEICDGHPFNASFISEAVQRHTIPVFLADISDLAQWKGKRGSEFLQRIKFSEDELIMLAALRDLGALDFSSLHAITEKGVDVAGKCLARLMDFHIVEGAGDVFEISPPLRAALAREPRFALAPNRRQKVLRIVSETLTAFSETDNISISMVDSAILAALQEDGGVPPLFAALLLPSHWVWLARRRYDDKKFDECIQLAHKALEGVERLSPAGRVEACRLLCLAAARRDKGGDFDKGISILRGLTGDRFTRSNLSFLLGFRARLRGNLPEAEGHLREAYRESPGNFSAARELASISMLRGDLESAEVFAREAYRRTSLDDNPYILDILLSVLIKTLRHQHNEQTAEIDMLFEKLATVGDNDGRSFYTTRRAEYESKNGNMSEACRLIDDAVSKTPGIFNVHYLRAKIYLERRIKTIVWDEIEKMRNVVYREADGERRSNLRPLLEIEADYCSLVGDYQKAKDIYKKREVFTQEEAEKATKLIEYDQSFRQR